MPRHYDTHYEDEQQEWDTIILNKTSSKESVKPPSNTNSITNDTTPLHIKIANYRRKKGYTSNQVASLLHMSLRNYMMIENNEMKPTPEVLNKLKKIINLYL
tara:strand:+ start:11618 stop:11923 length:306 start_codon:yes stop_codon:yes gene_type:complete